MKALEAFNAGSLDEAIDLAKNEVKSNPTDVAKRNVFCEMLCWAGDLKRADKQLETLMMQDPSSAMGMALFRQLIRGETARQECFNEGSLKWVFEDWLVLEIVRRAGVFAGQLNRRESRATRVVYCRRA